VTLRTAVKEGEVVRQVDPQKVVGFLEVSNDLSDWKGGSFDFTVDAPTLNDDNTVDFVLRSETSQPSAFMRINVR